MNQAEIEAIVAKVMGSLDEDQEIDPVQLQRRIEEAIFLARREAQYQAQATAAHEKVRQNNLPVFDK